MMVSINSNIAKCTLCFLAVIIGTALLTPVSTGFAGVTPSTINGFKLLSQENSELGIEYRLPDFTLTDRTVDATACLQLDAPEMAKIGLPGEPELLSSGVWLGSPIAGSVQVEVVSIEEKVQKLDKPLCPTNEPYVEVDLNGEVVESGQRENWFQSAYEQDVFQPNEWAVMELPGSIRSQQVNALRALPFHYNPVRNELRIAQRLVLRVRFVANDTVSIQPGSTDEGPFEAVLKASLLNYSQARNWRSSPSSLEAIDGMDMVSATTQYKMSIIKNGLYKLSYDYLQGAGVPVDSLDPTTFKITNQGVEVARRLVNAGSASFEPGDYLLFYGEKIDTRYTGTNIYWLSWGGAPGLEMGTTGGSPGGSGEVPVKFMSTEHMEVNFYYQPTRVSGTVPDYWYWDYLQVTSANVIKDFKTTLSNLSTEPGTVLVRGLLRGQSASPEHRAKIYLNGKLLLDSTWPAGTAYEFEQAALQSDLLEGENTIRVEAIYGSGITSQLFFVNWFEIDYSDSYKAEGDKLFFDGEGRGAQEFRVKGFSTSDLAVYDITLPGQPVQITNPTFLNNGGIYEVRFEQNLSSDRRYLALETLQQSTPADIQPDVGSNLKSSGNEADYIIITHADFLAQAQELANFRAGQGLQVMVVDVQDVYDEFSYGMLDSRAIHDFIEYAYKYWVKPVPAYVVLFGDGHYDFRNYRGLNQAYFIPPLLAVYDPWSGETASDNRYVTVSADNDILPDLFIGRLPARSTAEAQAMVTKIKNYETTTPTGGWNSKVLFVADNPDSGGEFYTQSDVAITELPAGYTADKVYYLQNYGDAGLAKAAIKAAINQGRLMVSYVGHGSVGFWAGEKLFEINDISTLTNSDRPTFMVPMTCNEGYFINPSSSSQALAESVVRADGKGAIASWSPVGQGLAVGHDVLEKGLFDAFFDLSIIELGSATNYSKMNLLASAPQHADLIDTYILFGDPATRLQTLPAAAPGAPTNLQVTAISSSRVDLTWQDNSSNESEFRIERSPDGTTGWQQIGVVGANTTSYSDTGLSCDTPYHYRVRAFRVGDGQFSTYSPVDSAVTFACQALGFVPGWNLITLPRTPVSSYNAETLLVAINAQGGACTETVEWLNGGWNSHTLGLPFGQFAIDMGKGYFVKCTQASSWSYGGNPLTSGVTLSLVPGWNLVGVPYPAQGHTAQSVLDGINGQAGACSEIVRWVNGGWESHTNGLPFNNFSILPDQGYFVKCSKTSNYTP